ncbi:MAG: RsmB/NOP family class I SAM-dependent RNA methyltransferase [Candidatus Altiarchaeota archaeon]
MDFPPNFSEKLNEVGIDPIEIYGKFLPPKYVRPNPRKIDLGILRNLLKEWGASIEEVTVRPDIIRVTNPGKIPLGETQEFRSGLFYIQDISSVYPVLSLDPKPAERILDLCAAPGLKTALMYDLTEGKADIIAVEQSLKRKKKLQHLLETYDISSVHVIHSDGRKFRDQGKFDKVLVDAPCSTEGKIAQIEDSIKTHWTSWKKIKGLAKLQKGLILKGFRLLKNGGTLVYSTCSFPRIENEDVVSYLQKKEETAVLEEEKRLNPLDVEGNGGFFAKIKKSF